MADPATMDYNRGYTPRKGYDPETGCIDFPEEDWAGWHGYFVNREPERFYAYIAATARSLVRSTYTPCPGRIGTTWASCWMRGIAGMATPRKRCVCC